MSLNKFLKGVANIVLDGYANSAKQIGHTDTYQGAKNLKKLVNGEVDWEGNPIRKNHDDDDDD